MTERMMKFTVIVPAEHELALLDVFAKLGLVHLDPQITEVALPSPELTEVRLETLERLKRVLDELKNSASLARDAALDIVSLRLAERFIESRDPQILKKFGLPEEAVALIEAVSEEFEKLKEATPSEELRDLIEEIGRGQVIRELLNCTRKYLREIESTAKMLGEEELAVIGKEIESIRVKGYKTAPVRKYSVKELKSLLDVGESALRELKHVQEALEKAKRQASETGKIDIDWEGVIRGLGEYVRLASQVLTCEHVIEALLRVQSYIKEFSLLRDIKVSVAEGWIPQSLVGRFEKMLSASIPRVLYLRVREPRHGERVPRLMKYEGLMGQLVKLTLMRGVPSYWEIDPTPIFTLLFVTMYGMMFGDIGLGIIVFMFGFLLRKAKGGFLGMSESGIKTLSMLSMLCGASATLFGALYGVAFLVKAWEPLLLSPLHDLTEIIALALIFGAVQLLLSMTLNVVNCLRVGEPFEAFFGARGLAGIVFYVAGAYLAYQIAAAGFNLSAAMSPRLLPVTMTAVGALGLVPSAFIAKGILTGHSEEAIHGVVELLELIVEYPANSLSYIRLAAFALAHEAFGILAEALADFIGFMPSLLFANFLVLAIEGFAVGIQALRLTYYEFSTKFFKGEGLLFRPVLSTVRA